MKEKGAIFFQQIWHVGRSSHPGRQIFLSPVSCRFFSTASQSISALLLQKCLHSKCVVFAEYQPEGRAPIAPSAVRISTDQKVFAPKTGEFVSFTTPRALEISEIPGIVQLYVKAARNSLKAGKALHVLSKRDLQSRKGHIVTLLQ